MFSLSGKVPGYLLGKYQMTTIVAVTLLFATIFVLVALPFSGNVWSRLDSADVMAFASAFCIISLVILVASRFLLYTVSKRNAPSYLKYIVWCVMEAVVISLFYAAVTYYASRNGLIDLGERTLFSLFWDTMAKTVFALAPPHIMAALYFALQEKENVIRLMNYGNVVSDETYTAQSSQKITLFDNNGVMKLSITAGNLYFIESDDNYIKVWYMDNDGIMKQYMLRCKLKTVEDSFTGSDLVRCHRQYIVNMAHVAMLYRLKDSYELRLDFEGLDPIPVTKTYEPNVLARFNSR